MSLTPQSRRPPIADLALVKTIAETMERHPEGVADLGPFRARLPSPAQLIAQALAGPPPTLLQQQYQSRIGLALTDLARSAGALAATANTLSPANGLNAFQQLGINSSHPEIASGYALAGAQAAVFRLIVQRLASPQENAGLLLTRGARTRIPAETHQLHIRSSSGPATVSITIEPDDTNEIALGEVVRAINGANTSVLANLANPTASTAQATVTSRGTGRLNKFSITDVPGHGQLCTLTGVQTVVQEAADASFVLNDIPTTAPDNIIRLQGEGLRCI